MNRYLHEVPTQTSGNGGRRAVLAPAVWLATGLLWVAGGIAGAAEPGKDGPSKEGLDFFEQKIRPVLAQQCYACHSAKAVEKGKLRGGLLLDSRAASLKGGESGPAVVPGKPDESLLVSALRHESFEMPPRGKLPDAVIADFVKWIEIGAPDPRDGKVVARPPMVDIAAGRQFWSFQPIQRTDPPDDATGWSRTPIDRFIQARLQAQNLHANPPAAARVLVRRAWFDLLGLPPSPEDYGTWVKRLTSNTGKSGDAGRINEEAWSDLIDHLLASEHYGERWARHWMDVARFAESHGYEQDYDRPNAYHYRDFLIRAFNQDLPYDQFVRWQLAGDELRPDEPLAWMATGFLGAGAFPTQLTEAEFESARYDELDDMVATTGVAFLGLSVGCARCHDHKFDPIPSRDYYRLAACFTTAIRSEHTLDTQPEANAQRQRDHDAKMVQLQSQRDMFERQELPQRLRAWLADYDPAGKDAAVWEVLEGELKASAGSKYERQPDGSYLAVGAPPNKEVLALRAKPSRKGLVAFRLEALADGSLPNKGPGRADNGNFALGDFQVAVVPPGGGEPRRIKLIEARATHQQNAASLSVAASIDEDPISGWAVDGQIGRDQAAVFVAEQPVDLDEGSALLLTMNFSHPNGKHEVGRFRLSVATSALAEAVVGNTGLDPKIVAALAFLKQNPPGEAPGDSEQWRTALAWFKTTLPDWQRLEQAITAHRKAGPGLGLTKVMVTSEGLPHLSHHADGRGFPHFYPETHLLRRGDVHQKEEVVEAGYLQVLMSDGYDVSHWKGEVPPEDSKASFRRSRLARWITDVDHGGGQLAARVMVNRLWQHHFGRGLVATPNDFGVSGERPTHPELLDWLAAELIDGGWQLKRMHKFMMTSSVYLQSSEFDPRRAERDRENTLYWRRTPRRLEAEPIRDAMLSVSGLLDPTMYGPGTLDMNMRRRSVYFFIKRSQLIPVMMLFDWPEHLVSIGQRASTTIAPQALMFMNSPQGRQYAEGLAEQVRRRTQATPNDERESRPELQRSRTVSTAYELAFGRQPTDREVQLAGAFLDRQAATHEAAGHGNKEHLALVDLCQTLMSMNEFVYID